MARNHGHRHLHDAHNLPHVVVELADWVEKASKVQSVAHKILKPAKIYSGIHAFREYDWIKGVPRFNTAGNFRGMVLNKEARIVYDTIVKGGKWVEHAGEGLAMAAIFFEIAKSGDKFAEIHQSKMPESERIQRYIATASMAILRAVTSPVPDGAHAMAHMTNKILGLAHAPKVWVASVNRADVFVRTTYDKQWNADNLVHFINTELVIH